ncbi:hypothetical protein [Halomonas sp. Mc5H-6]|uniref:hypothetical protein n=1 Tax=Halomonas sp. Mc5H-6 TaxID=2954500 RepID=UPI002097B2DE|nr:hypothetical protein [Halomonas sp. Mc5H-6]MCO7246399.1 hypothetical protein [Halomonas sp. Mc5H-6]
MAENETDNLLRAMLVMQADIIARIKRLEGASGAGLPFDAGHIDRMEALDSVSELLKDTQGDELKEMIRRISAGEE